MLSGMQKIIISEILVTRKQNRQDSRTVIRERGRVKERRKKKRKE